MKIEFYVQPEFLMADIPIKEGTFNDHRIWIYHRLSFSLVELVCLDDIGEFDFKGLQKDFIYSRKDGISERWKAVFVQNNCELTENDPEDVLNRLFEYFLNYLKWADDNITQNNL